MPNTDFTPDLSKLDKDYQILTELHGDANSRTYLARHLQLNRDVTITVVQAPPDSTRNELTHFAADARLLTTMRHPNVVPVIEGIWLDDKTFAVVRARVRGSTLDQLISAVGPVPIARVTTTIQQVQSALEWARAGGVVHRRITPQSVVFQQGNGRVLLSLELAPLASDAMPGECDDAQTIGQLASDMLSGQVAGNEEPTSAVIVPPQIVPAVAQAIEAVRHCNRNGASSAVANLMTALQGASGEQHAAPEPVANASATEVTPPIKQTPVAPVVAPVAAVSEPVIVRPTPRSSERLRQPTSTPRTPANRKVAVPVGGSGDAVVVVKPAFGYNARLGTAIAVAAIIAVMALLLFRHRDNPNFTALAANDTIQQASGDVVPNAQRPDSSAMVSSLPVPSSPPPTQTGVAPGQIPGTTTPAVIPRSPIMPPDTPRHEPPRTAPPSTFPLPTAATRDSAESERKPIRASDTSAAAERKPARDSATSANDVDACASPAADDQHKCLMAAIDRNDRELNAVYAKLIAALRRQASSAAGDPDPETVEQLRSAQRKWVDERDVACRGVGDGPLYARSRSSCFAQQSANRTRELQRMLEAVPPTF